MNDVLLFLKQMDKPGMAIDVRQMWEENYQLKMDLEHEMLRCKFAEKMYLEEVDKSWLAKIFG